ncbi:hypothetical protein D1872_269750 [compost metagenome]
MQHLMHTLLAHRTIGFERGSSHTQFTHFHFIGVADDTPCKDGGDTAMPDDLARKQPAGTTLRSGNGALSLHQKTTHNFGEIFTDKRLHAEILFNGLL